MSRAAWVFLAAASLGLASGPSFAQQRHPMTSICVGCGDAVRAKPASRSRQQARRASRQRGIVARRVVPWSGSSASAVESQTRSFNRSVLQHQEQVGASQQTQFELNQLRNNTLSRPIGSGLLPGCPAGSIGC